MSSQSKGQSHHVTVTNEGKELMPVSRVVLKFSKAYGIDNIRGNFVGEKWGEAVDEEDEEEEDVDCQHNNVQEKCMVCIECLLCTGYGSGCFNHKPNRKGGVKCGCGRGKSGCNKCFKCLKCQKKKSKKKKKKKKK